VRPVAGNEPFNTTTALRLALFSAITHCGLESVQEWSCAGCKLVPNCHVYATFKNNVTDTGFVVYDPSTDSVVVAYIGTYNLQTLFQDFELTRTHFPNTTGDVHVHKGWYDGWRDLRGLVFMGVASALDSHPNATVWCTGHSLGGSLAELTAVDLAVSLDLPVRSYTFGTPRVGNEAWAALVAQSLVAYYRVTHRQDLIPLYPPRSAGYHHPTQEVWYDNDTGTSCVSRCFFFSLRFLIVFNPTDT
jgi:hypothetical protein